MQTIKKQASRFKRAVCFFFILCHFMIITVLFSRINFKTNVEDTLGAARPQTCARAVTALDPQPAK